MRHITKGPSRGTTRRQLWSRVVPCRYHPGWLKISGREPIIRLPKSHDLIRSSTRYRCRCTRVPYVCVERHRDELPPPRHLGEARPLSHTVLGLRNKLRLPPDSEPCRNCSIWRILSLGSNATSHMSGNHYKRVSTWRKNGNRLDNCLG